MTVERDYATAIAMLSDGLDYQTSVFQPTRTKTKINYALYV